MTRTLMICLMVITLAVPALAGATSYRMSVRSTVPQELTGNQTLLLVEDQAQGDYAETVEVGPEIRTAC